MATQSAWQILFVDDDQEFLRQVREALDEENIEGCMVEVQTHDDFDEALVALETHRFDLLILDYKIGRYENISHNEAGLKTLEAVRERRFIPVIFYTGLPEYVKHLQVDFPLIQIIEKSTGIFNLKNAVSHIFSTGLPLANRALIEHIEAVQRDYMWNFVAKHWEDVAQIKDQTQVAYLLARRLAHSLSKGGVSQLVQSMGGATQNSPENEMIHPMEYYVLPPLEGSYPLVGEICLLKERQEYRVILTPSCDLVPGREKADQVLLALCLPLSELDDFRAWKSNKSKNSQEKLEKLLKNNRKERYHFLPGTFKFPDLIVDFQQLVSIPIQQLEEFERLASLDSPFAEALLSRFTRYFGRLGTPDLDINLVIQQLLQVQD